MEIHVSILMPSYNSASYIDQAIQSVVGQTYPYWELLIVDDCSSDNTRQRIEFWKANDPRIKPIFLNSNQGAANARNAGLQVALGRYIALLDSDDLWHPQKLEKQISLMKIDDTPLTYTAYEEIDEENKSIALRTDLPDKTDYKQMLGWNVIGCPTAIYDSGILGKVQMPDVFHADYATWLKILKKGYIATGLLEPLAYYRIRKGSLNRNKLRAAWHRWRVYRDCEELPFIKCLEHFSNYACNSFRR